MVSGKKKSRRLSPIVDQSLNFSDEQMWQAASLTV
jgi:hypothetical protein